MRRWKVACIVASAVVLAATLFVVLPQSSSAASSIKSTIGRIFTEENSALVIDVHNTSTKPVTFSIALFNAFGFTSTTDAGTVPAGGLAQIVFSCPAAVGNCFGSPIVTTSSKGAVLSATFIEDAGTSTHAFAGDWVIFK